MSLERWILVSTLHPLGTEKLPFEGPQPFIPASPRPTAKEEQARQVEGGPVVCTRGTVGMSGARQPWEREQLPPWMESGGHCECQGAKKEGKKWHNGGERGEERARRRGRRSTVILGEERRQGKECGHHDLKTVLCWCCPIFQASPLLFVPRLSHSSSPRSCPSLPPGLTYQSWKDVLCHQLNAHLSLSRLFFIYLPPT